MTGTCPNFNGDPAIGLTAAAFDKYSTFAAGAVTSVQNAITDFATYQISPIQFDITFDDDGSIGSYFFPARPTVPVIAFTPTANPPSPPNTLVTTPVLTNPPVDDVERPIINALTAPSITLPPQPGAAPPLATIVIPDAPTITLPAFPDLRVIVLPTAPALTLPTFQGERPQITFNAPANTFAFTPTEYTSALLTKTDNTISVMLDGDTGLPFAVMQALRARADGGIDVQEARAVQQAIEEFGGLAYEEPNGILIRRIAEVRQNNQNQRNTVARDIYIQDQQIAIENRRWAVSQGVALESARFSAHVQFMQVALDSAKTTVMIGIQLFQAQVELFNAQEKAYETDATVFRTLLDGEIAKVTLYKEQIEAQALIGQLNEQDVRIVAEKIQALLTVVEIYKAQIAGKQAQADVNKTVIEAFRAQVEAYAAEVRGYEAAWDGFKAQADAEFTKAKIYEAATNAFGTRVQAWGKQQDVRISATDLQIRQRDLDIRAWEQQLELFKAKVAAERDRVSAEVQVFQGDVDLYKADASIQQVASEVNQRGLQLALARSQAKVDTALKNTQLAIEQLEKLTALKIEITKSIANVEAQLAAASMSAVSFHAGVTSSRSDSKSCGTEFQFVGSAN